MTHYNLSVRHSKPVHIDELSSHSDGHDAPGKEEIQDFTLSFLQPTARLSESIQKVASIPSNQCELTVQKTKLYQPSPRRRNTFDSVTNRRSWTDSRETHQNAARREYHLLLTNPREANHFITLKYLREFSAQRIRTTWTILKDLLKQQGIVAFSIAEITTRPHVLSNGSRRYYPINRIHYHLLVDSDLSERQLRDIFNHSAVDAGLMKNEFEVQYESIPDRKTFERKCKYTLKFDNFSEQAILFQPGTGINKVASIGRWFINADGTRASKDKMWKSIVAGWYSK
jgi:hypothetical protein